MQNNDYRLKEYLKEYLESKGIDIRRRFTCLNPNHMDRHPSMQYYQKDSRVHCFGCGADYSLIDLLMIEYDVDVAEAFDIARWKYCEHDKVKVNQTSQGHLRYSRKSETEQIQHANLNFTIETFKAHFKAKETNKLKHFLDRGISESVADAYMLGYVDEYNDMFSDYPDYKSKNRNQRLYNYIIPFLNNDNTCGYFVAELSNRSLQDAYTPKYIKINNLNGQFPAQLFNERYIIEDTPEYIFITEGPYDALSFESVGHFAIGLIGTSHHRLLELCKKYHPNTHLIISLDNDDAGRIATERIINGLDKIGMPYSVKNLCRDYKDPNEALMLAPDLFESDSWKVVAELLGYPNE